MLALSASPRLRAGALLPMLSARLQKDSELDILRHYVANGIRLIAENTAKVVGGNYLTVSYEEIIHPKPKDERTGDEIAADVIRGAGLKIV